MTNFWHRMKQRKLVQWAVAYLAGAWGFLQVLELAADSYGWPSVVIRIAFALIALGFLVTLVLAWYHGERGVQKVSGAELLVLALLFVIGGTLLWRYASTATAEQPGAGVGAAASMAAASTVAAAGKRDPKSIAVLPFENLSADKDNAYFAGGMQDMILTKLADIRDLKVISRTSTQEYGSKPANLKLVGQQLGVATVLEGSVQKAGNQVLINLQLIDTNTDTHLWAQVYRRTLDNIFDVEAEVAQKVAEALHSSLSDAERKAVARAATHSPEAYQLYLKGNYESRQYYGGDHQPAQLLQAEAYYRQATVKDPDFALAHAQLAGRIASVWENGIKDSPQRRAEAMAHARKALALQPDLPEAHVAMAIVLQSSHNDSAKAISELQIARSLAPNDAGAPAVLAQILLAQGRLREARAANADALRLDPRSENTIYWRAIILLQLGDYDEARRVIDRMIAEFPDQTVGPDLSAQLFLLRGDPVAARRALAKLPDDQAARKLSRAFFFSRDYRAMAAAATRIPAADGPRSAGRRELKQGIAAHQLGDKAAAREAFANAAQAIDRAIRTLPNYFYLPLRLAEVRMWQGDRGGAVQALARARQLVAGSPLPYADELLIKEQDAEILAHFGDAEAAAKELRELMETPVTPWFLSPALLRMDPIWDPIRASKPFQALLRDYPADGPAAEKTP